MKTHGLTLSSCKDRLTVQTRERVSTAMGTMTVNWSETGRFWGLVTPLAARARTTGTGLQGEATHAVLFRSAVVLEMGKHRILWDGRAFEPIAPRERYDGATVIECKEVTE